MTTYSIPVRISENDVRAINSLNYQTMPTHALKDARAQLTVDLDDTFRGGAREEALYALSLQIEHELALREIDDPRVAEGLGC